MDNPLLYHLLSYYTFLYQIIQIVTLFIISRLTSWLT